MKQIIRYISIVVLLMTSIAALARGGEQPLVEIATLTNGTITSSMEGQTCTLTVTPADGFYISKKDIKVQKTVSPNAAITRGDINMTEDLTLTGDDPAALSATRTYTFDIPEGYNVYVKATFKACTKISLSVSMSGWTFGSEASSPSVTGNTGNAPVTYSYAARGSNEFTAAKPVNAGDYIVKATIPAIGIYTAAEATADFTIAAKPEPETPDTPTEPNAEVVNPDETVTVGGETFYEPKEETKEALKEHFDTDFALSAEAANSMTVNSNGEMEFKQGKNVDVAIANKQKGDVMKFEFTGKMYGDSSKLRQKGVASTRSAGDMELISGAEYEVLETGSIVITVAAQEAPVTFKGISTTAAGATGIETVNKEQQAADSWYDLNGQRLPSKPTKKGLYIRNGQKIVIK